MNDVSGLHIIAGGDLGFADITSAETLAGLEQFRSGSIMNRAVNTAPAEQRRICSIYGSLDVQ